MNTNKCPVCGKSDIPDYLHEDVICPCCGSDLSVFKMVDELESNRASSSAFWKIAFVVLCVMAIVYMGLLVAKPDIADGNGDTSVLTATIDSLKGVNEGLSGQLKAMTQENEPSYFAYVVRHGDSFRLISRRLYGTERFWSEIAKSNGIADTDILHPGDTLKIKNLYGTPQLD